MVSNGMCAPFIKYFKNFVVSLSDERTSSLVPTSLFESDSISINESFYSCLNEVCTFRVVGPVHLCVCLSGSLSVHLHHILAGKTCRGVILGNR